MKLSTEQGKLFVFAGIGLAVLVAVGVFVWKGSDLTAKRSPQQRVAEIMEEGIDLSNSLFPDEDEAAVLAKVDERKSKFLSGSDATAQNLMDMARHVRDLRDYDTALELFAVLDLMTPPDQFYKIDVGNIYLERQQWEEARQVFEPLRVTLPIHETYIGLAEAYKHIEGTPDYVIDEIYKEGEWKTMTFAVYEEHAEWLTEIGREAETIPLYEHMYELAPQTILDEKIKELKAKYAK